MKKKRILLIHNDRTLLKLYREKLEDSGFDVEATRELDQASREIEKRTPDLILLDLVFLRGKPVNFITSVRKQTLTAKTPILVLPTSLVEMVAAAMHSGATSAIPESETPLASTIRTVLATLGLPDIDAKRFDALSKASNLWVSSVLSGAVENINLMRQCLPGISAQPPELPALRELWTLVHAFADKTVLMPYKPLAQFAGALSLLIRDLDTMPEQINPSILRTVCQALDFLASIADIEQLQRLTDASSGNVLVVDDEQSARQFIMSALEYAGIKSDSAASPASALDRLNGPKPDVIFLDVGLPEMNGFDLCTKIRTVEAYQKTPIVFITGMATFVNKAKANLSGGNDFVGKPFNLLELGVKALTWLFRGQLEPA